MDMLVNLLGFLFGLAASVLAIVLGIINSSAGAIAFGVWGLISVVLAWFSGAKGSPTGNPFKKQIGAKFKEVPSGTWAIIAVLFVVAALITIFVK
ncbi:MAG: hypothetical protein AB1791_11950 [Chloroflexota bacterium]